MNRANIKLLIMNSSGFSLVELVITLALAAAMLTVGVPAFNNVMENNALAGISNRFVSSLALARSEAVTRNADVVVCRLNSSGNGCVTAGTSTWSDGWIIWADSDGDTIIDGDEIIDRNDALEEGYTLASVGSDYDYTITFNAIGEATGDGGSDDIFRLCDPDNNNDRTRLIYLSAVGNAWVNRTAGSTDAATDCPTS